MTPVLNLADQFYKDKKKNKMLLYSAPKFFSIAFLKNMSPLIVPSLINEPPVIDFSLYF